MEGQGGGRGAGRIGGKGEVVDRKMRRRKRK